MRSLSLSKCPAWAITPVKRRIRPTSQPASRVEQGKKKHRPTGVQRYNKRNTQALSGYALQDLPITKNNPLTGENTKYWEESPQRLNIDSPNHSITIYSGTLIFLLRLGIINAGHFDRLSDRIVSALAAQETRQAQGTNGTKSPKKKRLTKKSNWLWG